MNAFGGDHVRLAKLFISIIVLWILNIDHTLAFDCSKAFLSVDYTICAYPELLEAESDLEEAYHTLRNSSAQNPEKVKDDQRRWIKGFGPSCGLPDKGKPSSAEMRGTRDCVWKALKDRTAYLKSFASDAAPPQTNASCLLSPLVPCHATEYTLGSMVLRKSFPNELSTRYVCFPRKEFSNTIQCNLKNLPTANSGASSMADTLIKSLDGRILYAYDKSEEAGQIDQIANNITSEVSKTLGNLTPRRFSLDGAAVAIWGEIKLEEISSGSDEYQEIKGLMEQKYGLLVTVTGDINSSKGDSRPVYRVIGGDGLAIIISQNRQRRTVVQRFVVAAGTLAERNFDSQAHQFLMGDQASPPNDFSKWPEIAFMIRRLALNTTPENANRVVDETFGSATSKKYYSHAWAFLPTSVINHLRKQTYWSADVFNKNTEFPNIRDKIIWQLKEAPKEPFSEFLLYTLGRFDEAVKFNPTSPIHTVLTYALGHSTLRQVMSILFQKLAKADDQALFSHRIIFKSYLSDETYENDELKDQTAEEKNIALSKKDFFTGHSEENIKDEDHDNYKDNLPSVTQYLNYFNQFPERYNSRPIVFKVPEFASLTEKLLPQFTEVLKDRSSPHFDDAAYLLGWLAYHRGNVADALDKFEIAIALIPKDVSQSENLHEKPDEVDYADYAFPALHQADRILRTLPPEDALNRVQNSKILSSQSKSWEEVLTSLYHSHKYQLVMSGAQRALRNFGITIENLPVTTDPKRIEATFTKLKLADDAALKEIVYLYFASREIGQVIEMLSDSSQPPPSSIGEKIKEVVIKYSVTRDSDLEEQVFFRRGAKSLHKDLRQSLFIAQKALDSLPKTVNFSKLRQWLHYQRIVLLAQFDPIKVHAANAEFQNEFPDSSLLDDGMAEQIFAEAVIVGDMVKATATFDTIRQRFPKGNAIDNAYSWMAIGWTCKGEPLKARNIDQEIVRLFPLSRHARYARKRIRNPAACGALKELYMWDHWAMRWRDRDRIDSIQESLKASGVESTSSKLR
jgi:uncharacterized protein YecT (DUF1311 family)/tetratricopeptide (TPR) repeat protein